MGYGLWVMDPISGFRLPFPNFLLSKFLLFRRLLWPILRPLCFLWRLVGLRREVWTLRVISRISRLKMPWSIGRSAPCLTR